MGQNFLQDDDLARWMADSLQAGPEDTIIEIGPGLGAVTKHLIGRSRRLILVEKDARLAASLRENCREHPSIEIIEADAVSLDLRPFFQYGPLKVLGNLPYSVGTTIMAEWLTTPSPVGHAVFMLQKEVCERVTASPRSGDYGQLTVRLQARWQASIVRHVPPDSFHPRPAVDSAIVSLQPRNRHELPVFDEHLFSHLVRLGFSQRRKQLKNVLGQLPKPWPELCEALKITESARAEELSVARWIELTRLSDPHPLHDTPQSAGEIFDVVNDQNQVVSQATRAEVHARALKHRAVHIFAFTPSGELLLQKRSHLKDTCPSLWDSSAAGHLDAGESYEAAVTRELHEELGLKPSASTPVFQARLDACPETGWEFVELYAVTISPSRIRFPAAEIEAVRAFPIDMVTAWTAARPQDFAPGFLRCWHEWQALAPAPAHEPAPENVRLPETSPPPS